MCYFPTVTISDEMNEIPSDSNAFNILSGLQAWQLRREVISGVTIENDDKA